MFYDMTSAHDVLSAGSESPTVLVQALAAPPAAPPPTPTDLLAAARAAFLRGQRVELRSLAGDLGVSRGTVHRWVGSREQLLGEVLWSLCADTFSIAIARRTRSGPHGAIDVLSDLVRMVASHPAMIQFLESEPEMALRALTAKRSVVQPRVVATMQRLLEIEAQAGLIREDIDVHALAYTLVRVSESWLYTNLISGESPDLHQGDVMMRLVIDGATTRAGQGPRSAAGTTAIPSGRR
jgi:AcrR family transcriptional regulator